MKKEYFILSLEVTSEVDIISTSSEVESERIEFTNIYGDEAYHF